MNLIYFRIYLKKFPYNIQDCMCCIHGQTITYKLFKIDNNITNKEFSQLLNSYLK